MNDLRTAAQQALDSINELFAAEQSEGGERGGHIRTPATREHLVRVAQARRALHESCDTLRAALAQQATPTQPFGYWFPDRHQDAVCSGWFVRSPCDGKIDGKPGVPLYAAPLQRKPLPKHDQHCVDVPGYGLMAVRLVRAVERAHGIKE